MADNLIPGSQLPEPIDEERLKILTEKLRNGQATDEEIDEIAMGHLRLAMHYATKFARQQTTKEDIFISDALFGLVMAIVNAKERLTHDDLTRYVVAWMRKFLFKTLTEDKIVPIPYTTLKRRQKKGLTTQIPRPMSMPQYRTHSPQSLYDLRDLIYGCVKRDFEGQVIRLREMGKTDKEIAEILQCSRSNVTMAKNAVMRRFDKEMEK